MYNNGYMNGVTSKVTLAMRNLQTSVDNRRFANGLNKPKVVTPKDREIPKRGINDPYTPKVTAKQSRVLDDVYFRLVCTKESMGNIPTKDSMIIKFKDVNDQLIETKNVYIVKNKIDYTAEVCRIALKYGAGVISYSGGVVNVSARPMRKTYIKEEEQKRLLNEGYAIRVRD